MMLYVGEMEDGSVSADMVAGEAALQQTETTAEGELLLVREVLAGEDQDRVGVPCVLDGREGLVAERVQPDVFTTAPSVASHGVI